MGYGNIELDGSHLGRDDPVEHLRMVCGGPEVSAGGGGPESRQPAEGHGPEQDVRGRVPQQHR